MKQTAVEWLQEKLENGIIAGEAWKDLLIVAKAMEKEQIMDAHFDGQCDETEGYPIEIAEQYYNETFKSEI